MACDDPQLEIIEQTNAIQVTTTECTITLQNTISSVIQIIQQGGGGGSGVSSFVPRTGIVVTTTECTITLQNTISSVIQIIQQGGGGGSGVSSFGPAGVPRTGIVVTQSGDYTTDMVAEGTTNKYFTNALAVAAVVAVIAGPLTWDGTHLGVQQASASVDGYLGHTDWNTFNNKQAAITAGTTSQYWRGDKTFQTLDTSVVPENSNLYWTQSRFNAAIASISGAANGIAPLDSGGKISTSYLPASVIGDVAYQGTWNATSNSPSLASGTGTKGYYYIVTTPGSTNLDGITDWKVGDWAIYNGTAWNKVDNTDSVTSVNSLTGVITLNTDNIAESGSPTNLWFTNTRARAAISATSPIGYNNSTGIISISQATTSTNGYLSSTDWNTFNGKATLASFSAVAPITYNSGTGAIGFNYATAGTFTGKQTFSTVAPVFNTAAANSILFVDASKNLAGTSNATLDSAGNLTSTSLFFGNTLTQHVSQSQGSNWGVGLGSGGTLAANTTYYYVYTVLDPMGNESLPSGEMSITTNTVNKSASMFLNLFYSTDGGVKIYRSTTSGSYGANSLLISIPNTNYAQQQYYTDTGTATTAGSPPTTSSYVGFSVDPTGNILFQGGVSGLGGFFNVGFSDNNSQMIFAGVTGAIVNLYGGSITDTPGASGNINLTAADGRIDGSGALTVAYNSTTGTKATIYDIPSFAPTGGNEATAFSLSGDTTNYGNGMVWAGDSTYIYGTYNDGGLSQLILQADANINTALTLSGTTAYFNGDFTANSLNSGIGYIDDTRVFSVSSSYTGNQVLSVLDSSDNIAIGYNGNAGALTIYKPTTFPDNVTLILNPSGSDQNVVYINGNPWVESSGGVVSIGVDYYTEFYGKFGGEVDASILKDISGFAGSAGQIMGNAGGVPAWQAFPSISLTSGVTGILPVANGGSGTSTAFTTGSVVFAGASGVYTYDSNFFYDSTNHRLCLGTATSIEKLTLKGNLAFPASSGGGATYTIYSATSGVGNGDNIQLTASNGFTGGFTGGNLGFTAGNSSAVPNDYGFGNQGGLINFTTGNGADNITGTTSDPVVGGPGGDVNFTGANGGRAAGGSGSTNRGGVGGSVFFTSGNGGATGTNTASGGVIQNAGGQGGQVNFISGDGGSGATGPSFGGTGGPIAFITGNGGAAASGKNGGGSGQLEFLIGIGAATTNATGGASGNITILGAVGGQGTSSGANTATGGAGSSLNATLGAGGAGVMASGSTTSGGAGGSFTFTAGAGGSVTGTGGSTVNAGQGGSLTFIAGASGTLPTTGFTGKNGGNINFTAGAATSSTGYTNTGGNIYFIPGAGSPSGTAGNIFLGQNSSGTTLGNIQIGNAVNIVLGTSTGTKFGTATSQKLSLWNATPIVQPTTAISAATFVTNTSGTLNDTATWGGYTIGQVVQALRNIGALA
jgi:hypothetical protein